MKTHRRQSRKVSSGTGEGRRRERCVRYVSGESASNLAGLEEPNHDAG